MSKFVQEPFAWYRGIGRPYLAIKRNPKWAHAIWFDGSLWRYPEFRAHVGEACLYDQLRPLFYDNWDRLCARSSLCGDQCSGHLAYWPPDMADEAYSRILGVFNGALEAMDAVPDGVARRRASFGAAPP